MKIFFGLLWCSVFLNTDAIQKLFESSSSIHSEASAFVPTGLSALLNKYALICGPSGLCDQTKKFSPFTNQDIYQNSSRCPKCFCDEGCYFRLDCCPDVLFSLQKPRCRNIKAIRNKFDLLLPTDNVPMIDTCPPDSSSELKQKCEATYGSSELMLNPPVVSNRFDITFRNRDCAKCNNVFDTRKWKLDIECDRLVNFNFISDYGKLATLAEKAGCEARFKNSQQSVVCQGDKIPYPMHEHNETLKNTINQCNVTGYWSIYDASIEKACLSTYVLPYQHYKNVFCFMCNPPIIDKSLRVISACNTTELWAPLDIKLRQACTESELTVFTFPFKNVYCHMCNVNHTLESTYHDAHVNISYTIQSFVGNMMQYDIKIKRFQHSSVLQHIDRFASTNLDSPKSLSMLYGNDISERNMTKLITLDYAVNGFKHYCNDSVIGNRHVFVNTPRCFCSDISCFFDNTKVCCMELLMDNPLSCYTNTISHFKHTSLQQNIRTFVKQPNKENINYSENAIRQKLDELFRRRYTFVDKCLNFNENEQIKHNCENSNSSNMLSIIPIQDQNTKIIYRNFYCFLCNNYNVTQAQPTEIIVPEHYEPWVFSMICSVPLNVGFYTNVQQILDLGRDKGCYISVEPTKNQTLHASKGTYKCQDDNLINTCNSTGSSFQTDEDVRWACENGSSLQASQAPYKNVFCAICNPTFDFQYRQQFDNCSQNVQFYGSNIIDACAVFPSVPFTFPYKNIFCKSCIIGSRIPYVTPNINPDHRVTSLPSIRDIFVPNFPIRRIVLEKRTFEMVEKENDQIYDTVSVSQ